MCNAFQVGHLTSTTVVTIEIYTVWLTRIESHRSFLHAHGVLIAQLLSVVLVADTIESVAGSCEYAFW